MIKTPLQALAELIQVERNVHGESAVGSGSQIGTGTGNGLTATRSSSSCLEVRHYAVVALTNLTFGNTKIKSFLCSYTGFIPIMVAQLASCSSERLIKATAHLFRNLAWKADKSSKQTLSQSNVVSVLMRAAMAAFNGVTAYESKEEPTLKVILSALWNLSSHGQKNKADVCSINGGLAFLVALLRQKSTSIVENGGGILRNVSSFVATSPDTGDKYREILRRQGCLELLLHQLKSSSLTIVSNSCGTLWNLSARCHEDQQALWNLGAVEMLQSLTNSKHKTISTCSSAALKNLYAAHPSGIQDVVNKGASIGIPSLQLRKRQNMVRGLSNQLLTAPNEPVYKGDQSDKSDADITDDEHEIEHVQVEQFLPNQRLLLVENMMENASSPATMPTTDYHTENNGSRGVELSTSSSHVEDEDIEDKPKDYSLQYEENDGPEEENDDINTVSSHNDLVVDNVEAVSYFTEGTPFDTPHGISNACSATDLNKTEQSSSGSGLETPEDIQLYAMEGTPGCFSRTDSVEDLVDQDEEKGTKEADEGPSEKATPIMEANNAIPPHQSDETQMEQDLNIQDTESKKAVSFMGSPVTHNLVQDTPLIASRSSSFESLNSFVQQPFQGSEYSSYQCSRMPSGRVSPSDLPDSPIMSRPCTPKSKPTAATRLPLVNQTAATGRNPDGTVRTAFPFTATVSKHPLPTVSAIANHNEAVPTTSASFSGDDATKNVLVQTRTTSFKIEDDFENENVRTFDEEGTPAVISGRASITDLTLSDEEEIDPKPTNEVKKEVIEAEEEEEDEDSSDDDEILKNLMIKGNTTVKKPSNSKFPVNSVNNHVDSVNNHVNSVNNHASHGPDSMNTGSRAFAFPSISSTTSGYGDCSEEVKTFCQEGTPSWMSKSNSQTNLSTLSIDENQKHDNKTHQDDSDSSDASADEELLQNVIKSAWGHSRNSSKPMPAVRSNLGMSLGQRSAGEGIPTTQANRSLAGITTIPCPTPAASTPHR